MAAVRAALNMPAANPQAREDAAAFRARVAQIDAAGCPHCGLDHWRTIQTLQRARPGGGDATSDGGNGGNGGNGGKPNTVPCRGPP